MLEKVKRRREVWHERVGMLDVHETKRDNGTWGVEQNENMG